MTFLLEWRPRNRAWRSTSTEKGLFALVEKQHRVFLRADGAPAIRLPMALGGLQPGEVPEPALRRTATGGIALRQALESQVLEQFAPLFMAVNCDGDVAYYSAKTGKYLEATARAPTRQILTVARKGLRLDFRTTLREAIETGRALSRGGVAVDAEDGRIQLVTLTVEPVHDCDGSKPLFLVFFDDEGPILSSGEALVGSQGAQEGAALRLEIELRETRERLQSLIEEYETALEELKAPNEELVSLNEDLQSTNEELEASKEELQSVNEELQAVTLELNNKVEAPSPTGWPRWMQNGMGKAGAGKGEAPEGMTPDA